MTPPMAEGWQQYVARVLTPAGAIPEQVTECRQAFYTGAGVVCEAIILSLSRGSDVTPADEALFQLIRAELDGVLARGEVPGRDGFVARGWYGYADLFVPKNADAVRIRETRTAFYAGVTVVYTVMMKTDLTLLSAMQDELDAHGQLLDLAVLGIKHGTMQ